MLEVIRQRRSARKFLDRAVEDSKLAEVLKSAMFAPTARGLRAWDFIIVKEREMLDRLSEATPFSGFVKNAPIAIVVCFDPEKGKRFKEDCSIAAAHIYLEAVNQGLGTCYVQISDASGPHGEAEDYLKGLLEMPAHYRVQCIMPLGYPESALPAHKDSEFEESKVHYGKF